MLADCYDPRATGTADPPWDRTGAQERLEKWVDGELECRFETVW